MTRNLLFVLGAVLFAVTVTAESEEHDYYYYYDEDYYSDNSQDSSEFDSIYDENEKAQVGDVKVKIPEEYGKQLLAFLEDPESPTPGITAKINDYSDKILDNVKHFMIRLGLDPMQAPDLHDGFRKRIIFITYTGSIDLTKGWLTDVSTIKRHEDALISYSNNSKKLRLEIPIAFDNLQFNSKYSAKFMGLGPVGGVEAKVRNVKMNIVVMIDFNTYEASLETFKITNSGFININFTGHILVDWLVNIFTDVTSLLLHPVILKMVSSTVKSGLDVAVQDINVIIQQMLHPAGFSSEPIVNAVLARME